MTLSGIFISLGKLGDIGSARRYRYLGADFLLEGFQDHLLEFIWLPSAEPFVGTVGDLLGFEAYMGMKLHFKSLAQYLAQSTGC